MSQEHDSEDIHKLVNVLYFCTTSALVSKEKDVVISIYCIIQYIWLSSQPNNLLQQQRPFNGL